MQDDIDAKFDARMAADTPHRRADGVADDAFAAYVRVAGHHQLLSALEERTLARALRAARRWRARALFAWPGALNDLLAQAPERALEADADAPGKLAALRDAWMHAARPRAARARAAALPWREAVLRPYIAEWRAQFKRTQAVERAMRQLCLFAAGMPRRYYAEHLPTDLLDLRWLETAARQRVISTRALRVLRLELEPVLAPLRALSAGLGMDLSTLRGGYRRLHEADRRYRALRDELARHNLRLVIAMARRYERTGVPMADLVQEGNVGLLRAIDKFDPALGYRFSTYATWWVRQGLQRAQLEQGRVVRLPAQVLDEARALYRCTEAFVHAHGREPRTDELARLAGMPATRVDTLRALFAEPLSFDAPIRPGAQGGRTLRGGDGDEGLSRLAFTPDDSAPALDALHDRTELRERLEALMRALPAEQAQLLRLRFGLGARDALAGDALRAILDLSPARLRELERRALETLRERGEALRVFLE